MAQTLSIFFLQKREYFRFRNKGTGKFMSTDGNLDDLNLLRIQVAEDTKTDEQIWIYQDGFIKSRVRSYRKISGKKCSLESITCFSIRKTEEY